MKGNARRRSIVGELPSAGEASCCPPSAAAKLKLPRRWPRPLVLPADVADGEARMRLWLVIGDAADLMGEPTRRLEGEACCCEGDSESGCVGLAGEAGRLLPRLVPPSWPPAGCRLAMSRRLSRSAASSVSAHCRCGLLSGLAPYELSEGADDTSSNTVGVLAAELAVGESAENGGAWPNGRGTEQNEESEEAGEDGVGMGPRGTCSLRARASGLPEVPLLVLEGGSRAGRAGGLPAELLGRELLP